MELRSQYTDRIINLMRKHIVTGIPVNPPIWWISPNDEEALVCDSGNIFRVYDPMLCIL